MSRRKSAHERAEDYKRSRSAQERDEDRDFLLEIYTGYYALMQYHVCKSIRAPDNRRIAEEIINGLILDFVYHVDLLRELKAQNRLEAYLTSAVLFAANSYRKYGRRFSVMLLPESWQCPDNNTPETLYEEQENNRETHEKVRAILDELPDREKALLRDFYMDELPRGEICGGLAITENSFYQALSRARKRARAVAERLLFGKRGTGK